MARILWPGPSSVQARFSADGNHVVLAPPVAGIEEVRITACFLHGYWQWKGLGVPGDRPLNGSMLDGQLIQLLEIDPDDSDLQ